MTIINNNVKMKLNKISIKSEKERLNKEFEQVKSRAMALENSLKEEQKRIIELQAQYKYLDELEKADPKNNKHK